MTTVVEQDLTEGPARFPDSVGIGAYRIDLHPSTGGDPYIDLACHPFEIPLGALVPERLENLLGAGKAIGTTHITNGAYRLHPVEWNVGEAAGHAVAHCAARGTTPRAVQATAGGAAARAGRRPAWSCTGAAVSVARCTGCEGGDAPARSAC